MKNEAAVPVEELEAEQKRREYLRWCATEAYKSVCHAHELPNTGPLKLYCIEQISNLIEFYHNTVDAKLVDKPPAID